MRLAQEPWDTGCRPQPEKGQDAENRCLKEKLGSAQGCLNKDWGWTEVICRRESAQELVQEGEAPKDRGGSGEGARDGVTY